LNKANNPNANTFLLKRYPTKDGEHRYNKKINGFRSVRQAESIIKFYGSYIHGENYNILLEFADKGSLEEYFRRESPPSRGGDIINFWEGLFQLIKGLKAIHSAREYVSNSTLFAFSVDVCRGHFDVRPDNILVVSNGAETSDWLFKFADFGASNVRGEISGNKLPKANEMKDTPTYGKQLASSRERLLTFL
jgi:serine/threonine protein kinase